MSEPSSTIQRSRLRTARPKAPAQLAAEYPISVIIPAYNAASYLHETLAALMLNDLTETEVLVVDDGSDDDLEALASRFPEAPLRLLRQPRRGGPAAARNRGAAESRNPYLFFMDADVVPPADTLLWLRESLDVYRHRPEVAGVLGTYSESILTHDFYSNYKNLYTCHLYRITDTLSPFVHSALFCIRRDVLESVGGFDGSLDTVEDFRLGLQLGSAGYRFVIDRRIEGRHLKTYTFAGILREDARRIRDLRKLNPKTGQRAFSLRAHRWNRLLSILLPLPTLLCAAAAYWFPTLGAPAVLLAAVFFLANLPFLNTCRRHKGLWFAFRAALFLWLEMLWAQLVLIAGPTIRT